MKAFKMLSAVLCSAVLLGTFGTSLGRPSSSGYPAPERYRLDASDSKFIAHALRGGLLWFKGHDHLVAASQFSGEAEITPDSIAPASLRLVVKTESMRETNSLFTEQQKQIIDKELREIVLLPAKYPEIVFQSTDVQGEVARQRPIRVEDRRRSHSERRDAPDCNSGAGDFDGKRSQSARQVFCRSI